MTDRPEHATAPAAADDLDALIGDLEAEAARRRAEPGFPVDAEARLAIDLDRQAPGHGTSSLRELLGALVDAATRLVETASDDDDGRRRPGRAGARPERSEELPALAAAVGAAVLGLARELDRLELRVARLEARPLGGAGPTDPPAG